MKLTEFISDRSFRKMLYYPDLATMCGGVSAAVFLSNLIYWHDRGADPDWIYKTQEQIEMETGLSRTEQDTARRQLKMLGFLRECRRGIPAKMHYHLDLEKLNSAFDIFSKIELPNMIAARAERKSNNKERRLQREQDEIGEEKPSNIDCLQDSCKQENNIESEEKNNNIDSLQVSRKQVCRNVANRLAGNLQTTTGITSGLSSFKKSTTKNQTKIEIKNSSSFDFQKCKSFENLPECILKVVPPEKRGKRHLGLILKALKNFEPEIIAANIKISSLKSSQSDPWGLVSDMLADMGDGADRHKGDREKAEKIEKQRLVKEEEARKKMEAEQREKDEAEIWEQRWNELSHKEKECFRKSAHEKCPWHDPKSGDFVIQYFALEIFKEQFQFDKAA